MLSHKNYKHYKTKKPTTEWTKNILKSHKTGCVNQSLDCKHHSFCRLIKSFPRTGTWFFCEAPLSVLMQKLARFWVEHHSLLSRIIVTCRCKKIFIKSPAFSTGIPVEILVRIHEEFHGHLFLPMLIYIWSSELRSEKHLTSFFSYSYFWDKW